MYDLEKEAIGKIEEARKSFKPRPISIISQQCIGGVIYHDMGMKFLSPTINLYFEAKDFIKFVENLKYYMKQEIEVKEEDGKIIGYLKDVRIIFLHYKNEEEARVKWKERSKRIVWDEIFIICTDRDGFNEECFKKFEELPYNKALITRNKKWENKDFCIYLKQYKEEEYIPDTIPKREFYRDNKIIMLLNK